jgi:hypothetical protein
MLQPDSLQSEPLNWLTTYNTTPQVKVHQQKPSLVDSSGFDPVLEALIPQGISPTKRAIIERLITLWVEKSEKSVA